MSINYASFVRAEDDRSPIKIENNVRSAFELVELGKNFYDRENYLEAIKYLKLARQQYRLEENILQEAIVLNNLALAYQQLQEYTKTKENLEASFKLIEMLALSSEKQTLLAQAFDIKGKLALTQGQANSAWESWEQAALNYHALDNQQGVIRSRINQAQALQILGYYRRAVKTLTSIQTQLVTQPDTIAKAVSLYSLGNALFAVGELELARSNLEASLKIVQSLKVENQISSVLLSLGNLARAQNNWKKAIAFYQKSASIAPNVIDKVRAKLNLLGLLIDSDRDYQNELIFIDDLITQLPQNRSAIYSQISYARHLLEIDNIKKYEPKITNLLEKAIADSQSIDNKYTEAYALKSLGNLYERKNRFSQAQQLTEQSLILAREINAKDIIYQGQWQLGRLLKAQNESQQAIDAYHLAVKTLQSLRSDLIAVNPEVQFTFRESIEPIYREYVSLLLDSSTTKEANLIAAREAIDSLQLAELENFFRATCLNTESVAIDRITENNDPTAAVIYPIVLEDRFEIILKLPQQQLRHYTTPIENAATTERMLQRLTQSLTQRNSRETLYLAQQVYNWTIEPLATDLAQNEIKTLVFVLDSPLRNIPMSVLHDGEQYLIEKYSIAIAPSLQLIQPKAIAQQKLTALTAGITEARDGFPALQYVSQELNTIESQIKETQQLVDSNFTRSTLQEKIDRIPFPIVHLATHGQFSSQAEETFILTWDERINVEGLHNLLRSGDRNFPIELLVLSACETLTGDSRAALGLAGVAVRAGARSTLATLWRVNDEATASIMGQFYQELAASKTAVSKAEALRRAQLSLLKSDRFNRPHFWASYVLVGNWL